MPRVSTLPVAAAPGTFYTIEGGVSKRINLGTIAVQNANAVDITGGTVAGITSLGVSGSAAITGVVETQTGGITTRLQSNSGDGKGYAGTVTNNNFGLLRNGAVLVEVQAGGLSATGFVNASGAIQVAGTQVLGTRKTGWAAATGTATRTTFATGTVTTAQLAERVKALIDDLISHGVIGP